jgi:hypothetical protein
MHLILLMDSPPNSTRGAVLAGATAGPLAAHDAALLEDLTAPNTKWFPPVECAGKTHLLHRASGAQRLRELDDGRGLSEPQLRIVDLTRQAQRRALTDRVSRHLSPGSGPVGSRHASGKPAVPANVRRMSHRIASLGEATSAPTRWLAAQLLQRRQTKRGQLTHRYSSLTTGSAAPVRRQHQSGPGIDHGAEQLTRLSQVFARSRTRTGQPCTGLARRWLRDAPLRRPRPRSGSPQRRPGQPPECRHTRAGRAGPTRQRARRLGRAAASWRRLPTRAPIGATPVRSTAARADERACQAPSRRSRCGTCRSRRR